MYWKLVSSVDDGQGVDFSRDTLPVTEELELFGEADKTDGTNGGTDGEHDDAIELTG